MRNILIMVILCFLYACNDQVHLTGFDKENWLADKDGCKNTRLDQIDTLVAQKDKLEGLSQNEVTELLGKADQHELYERSQKFFIYHLEAGKNCSNSSDKYFKALYIRFNSLGQAVAFTVQEIK